PLFVRELQEALAIEPEATALDMDNLLDINIVLSVCCAGLIILDDTASIVHPIHYTTQDYLDKFQIHRFSNAHTEIVSRCLSYFSLEEFLNLPTDSYDTWEDKWDHIHVPGGCIHCVQVVPQPWEI
ncbi:hypothetical protein DFH09DRAFT_913412, partial [Mycena vulgaris]